MKKRPYRNGEVWDFEAAMVSSSNGMGHHQQQVILGLDGGTSSTVCVCIPFINNDNKIDIISDGPLPDPPSVLARAVAGCSNHNSVGGKPPFSMTL